MNQCIIHVGARKTGSSSIQRSLNYYVDEAFVFGDINGHPNHGSALYCLFADNPGALAYRRNNPRFTSGINEYIAAARKGLEGAIDSASGRTVIFSGEGISHLFTVGELRRLHDYFVDRFQRLDIVAYVRPPAAYMGSNFQQRVKDSASKLSPRRDYVNYRSTFSKFDEVFGSKNVHLWKFEPKVFPNGCVVQDFCNRLEIDFPPGRIVRVNESISLEAVALLYTYRKYGLAHGSRSMTGPQNRRLVQQLTEIGGTKFRFSPDLTRPILEDNRADIEWMEARLRQSLQENINEHLPGDVCDELSLLNPNPESVEKLLTLLGDAAPADIRGQSPEEVALLVHALRGTRKPGKNNGKKTARVRVGNAYPTDSGEKLDIVQRNPGERSTYTDTQLNHGYERCTDGNETGLGENRSVPDPSGDTGDGDEWEGDHPHQSQHSAAPTTPGENFSSRLVDMRRRFLARNSTKRAYLFVHIPKTAGTSFRMALQETDSVRMLYDYGKNSPESSPQLIDIDPRQLTPDNEIIHSDKINFICGHVHYRRYAHYASPKSVVSIVRNPIERIVSEYQHLKRHHGLDSTFTDFCANVTEQNKQMRVLHGLGSKHDALIGLTSHYKCFIDVFSKRFAIPMRLGSMNAAPISDSKERLILAPSEINSAYAYNEKEMAWFFKMVRGFVKLVQMAGYRTIPTKDSKWNWRIDEAQRVVGWISCEMKDCYFVVIRVNGDRRAVVALDQYRRDVHKKGFSENPECGFSYPLALLGVEEGDEVSVGVFGSLGFDKILTVGPYRPSPVNAQGNTSVSPLC